MIRRAVSVVLAAAAVGAVLTAVRPRPAVPRARAPAPAPRQAEVRRVSERPASRPGRVRSATGEAVSTPFSVIQVRATLTGRELTRVETVALAGEPNERTRVLNEHAEPILRERALRAGSAKVDVVTGATYTSESYMRSLQSAIDRARRR